VASRPLSSLDLPERLLAWSRRRDERIAGHNPWEVTVRTGRAIIDDRVPGLAAEMAFFALLSLVPLIVAAGAGLGFLERVVGADRIARSEQAIIEGLSVVFSPELTDEVLDPFVRGLLSQQRGGLALGSLLITLYLSSRVFTATVRALDLAYDSPERRGALAQRAVAVGFALLAVFVLVTTLVVMIVGPLLGGGEVLARRLRLGDLFQLMWTIGRWPVLIAIVVGFFALVYKYGPNQDHRWRDCLPGAVLGVLLWIVASLGFRLYLELGGPQTPRFDPEQEALAAAGRMVGALIAAVLWLYVSGMSILIGGELNAELAKSRERSGD
jgi:membrane protein